MKITIHTMVYDSILDIKIKSNDDEEIFSTNIQLRARIQCCT